LTAGSEADGESPPRGSTRRARIVVAAYGALVAAPLLFLFGRLVVSGGVAPPRSPFPPPPIDPGLAAADPPIRAYPADAAPTFPDVAVFSLPGGDRSPLIDSASRPALFHFFALACESCAAEWPELRDLLMRGSGLPPIVPILVHPDEEADWRDRATAAVERVREQGWFGIPAADLRVDRVVGESSVLSRTGRSQPDRPLTGYPETLLVDEEGRIRLHVVGPVGWRRPVWERMLAEAWAADSATAER
jgi:hypothetical protein